jgi:GT2 family glycosyltransferase
LKSYEVDIIIPIYGHAEMTKRCIDSVLKTTGDNIHIILIDDCSPGNEIPILFNEYKNIERISLYRMPFNQGFIGSTKNGVRLGAAPYILFLNSDTEAIEENWVNKLIPQEKNMAIVGTKLLFPPTHPRILANRIQHAGVAIVENNENNYGVFHIFTGYSSGAPEVNRIRNVNTVTGACCLVRRDIWNRLNGWDDNFGKGVYEDVDFCWRVSQRGYDIIYDPVTYLYHYESANVEFNLNNKFQHPLHKDGGKNFQFLLKKWWGMIPINGDSFYGDDTIIRWRIYNKKLSESTNALNNNNLDMAEKCSLDCMTIAPEMSGSYYVQGLILSLTGCHKEAIEYIKVSIEKNPIFWQARIQLIKELLFAKRLDESKYELDLLKEIFPKNDRIIEELNWIVLGEF